jgi:POT family proton-dependent oligopeptide transporter
MAHEPSTSLVQPAGLRVIFFTEMWERFSYYGMRALLVLYLVNGLHIARTDALSLYGIYTGLVYLTPILGGALADRFLGKRRAILIGGSLMMLGHFAMAFEPLLYMALGLLILGNGFFKPNTTALVGDLYPSVNDPRRAGGYSIFYMGINLGAFLAPLVAGTLGENLGWHYGFAAAGIGMALGLTQFLWSQSTLGVAGLKASQTHLSKDDYILVLFWVLGCSVVLAAGVGTWSLWGEFFRSLSLISKAVVGVVMLMIAGYVIKHSTQNNSKSLPAPLTLSEWSRVLSIIIVMCFVIIFWTGFEQAGGTMTLFADEQTDRVVFGFLMPASMFQAINPLLIVLLAPLFSVLWTRLDQSHFALNDVVKQSLGMMVLGLGFVVMSEAQALADTGIKVGAQWLIAVYAIHTLGELMLSPVGLSMVSRIAPAPLASLMMGVWLLSNAFANYLAGSMESILKGSGLALYPTLATMSFAAGALLLVLSPLLKRMMAR